MTARVVAVEYGALAPPVEAILLAEEASGARMMRWWGGLAWETLDNSEHDDVLLDTANWRRVDIELPHDWESGYLKPVEDGVEFVYGRQPTRADWEQKRWSRRLVRKLFKRPLEEP